MTIGERLRNARHAIRITQAELGKRAGINHTYISLIETGRRNPHHSILSKLAHAVGLETEDLLLGKDQEQPEETLPPF